TWATSPSKGKLVGDEKDRPRRIRLHGHSVGTATESGHHGGGRVERTSQGGDLRLRRHENLLGKSQRRNVPSTVHDPEHRYLLSCRHPWQLESAGLGGFATGKDFGDVRREMVQAFGVFQAELAFG